MKLSNYEMIKKLIELYEEYTRLLNHRIEGVRLIINDRDDHYLELDYNDQLAITTLLSRKKEEIKRKLGDLGLTIEE